LVALSRLETLEQLLLHPVHDLGGLVDDRQPLLGDLHDVTAPILRIAAPGGEATLLELVQDRDEIRRINVKAAAERLLGELAVVAKLD
jgi:hypothetical protein